jgi:hypothetical protein
VFQLPSGNSKGVLPLVSFTMDVITEGSFVTPKTNTLPGLKGLSFRLGGG